MRRTRLLGIALTVALGLAGCATGAAHPAVAPAASPAATLASSGPTATLAPATGFAPEGDLETARVVRVVDGDTIIVDRGSGSERLRYIGIDTPESVKPDSPVEFMAHEASVANAALVEGREVVLETDVSDRDRFGRLLRYVWIRDGDAWTFVNLELVRRGYAQIATFPPDVRWRDEFADAQRVARDAGVGLWGPATPAP